MKFVENKHKLSSFKCSFDILTYAFISLIKTIAIEKFDLIQYDKIGILRNFSIE